MLEKNILNIYIDCVFSISSVSGSIEDDDEIERELEHVDITAKDKCVIQ